MHAIGPGARVGPYEIISALGAGGMGEVYRARDAKLGRDVAIKVLPAALTGDPDRLARFAREAQLLASLNHPHIAAIYHVEETGDSPALVMELVDGETLAERIARGAIPLEEAIPIARQIAEALEAAHEHGVIHRDLKPANIKLPPTGPVKVLDFGLAKLSGAGSTTGVAQGEATSEAAATRALSMSPTITSPALMTGVGVLLGTAAYMSPEQAKGKPADKRSDIWAFGCVLYEMLTGRRAFDGEDVADTLAAVLRGDPDWNALPADIPPPVTEFLKGALVKDPRQRVGDIAAAVFVLTRLATLSAPSSLPARVPSRLLVGAVVLIAALAVGVAGWLFGRGNGTPTDTTTRFTVSLKSDERFSNTGRHAIGLSPDGRTLVYVANFRLYLRPLDRLEAMPIPGTESTGGANSPGTIRDPVFSPDGQWLGFWLDGQIRKVGISGGVPVPICPVTNPFGISWSADGSILFAEAGRIWRVPDSGGQPQVILDNLNGQVQSPELVAGGESIIYTLFPADRPSQPEIVERSLSSGIAHTLLRGGIDAHYVDTGHLVYYAGGSLLAVRFDPRTLTISGAPRAVAENLASGSVPGRITNGVAQVAISKSGTLAYIQGTFAESTARTLAWVDRVGHETPIAIDPRPYTYPRISPDGTRIALTVRDQEQDIWIWNIAARMLSRFTFDAGDDRYSAWTPDGKRIAFSSNRGGEAGLWWQAADGTGAPERIAAFPITRYLYFTPNTWSPDGMRVVGTATPGGGGFEGAAPSVVGPVTPDVWMVTLDGERHTTALVQTAFTERNAEVSPDGRWIAYESLESGRPEVYVRPFPDVAAGKWQASTDGGTQPLWSRNGSELYYVSRRNELMGAAVQRGAAFALGPLRKILDGQYAWSVPTYAGRMYDVTRDGRFLLLKNVPGATQSALPAITIVEHWTNELQKTLPPR